MRLNEHQQWLEVEKVLHVPQTEVNGSQRKLLNKIPNVKANRGINKYIFYISKYVYKHIHIYRYLKCTLVFKPDRRLEGLKMYFRNIFALLQHFYQTSFGLQLMLIRTKESHLQMPHRADIVVS